MKKLLSLMLVLRTLLAFPQVDFNTYFSDKTLRFDFILAGNNQKTYVYPAAMKEEPF